MQIQDITYQILDAMEKGNIKSTADQFTDNFRFTGPMPKPLTKDEFLDLMAKINKGVPNLKFGHREYHVNGQTVNVTIQVSGTQSRTLPSLMPGMPELPPTNKTFRLPPETLQVTFQGDKISKIHDDPV